VWEAPCGAREDLHWRTPEQYPGRKHWAGLLPLLDQGREVVRQTLQGVARHAELLMALAGAGTGRSPACDAVELAQLESSCEPGQPNLGGAGGWTWRPTLLASGATVPMTSGFDSARFDRPKEWNSYSRRRLSEGI